MLQLTNICKQYKTGELVQRALDDVSVNLRDNEFVAILGPSGSGKTTLLNVIGGLDRYDRGDLIINGISTKKYKDRDWDSYRNHTIGFVFQSYNLIPHQSILANVELALTISGIKRKERRQRAKQALEQVGLGDQLHKKPNQMSGGQMQRVAIARALINNPDILLADEPTGALDTETSVQVMELLKEVAKDRLVVMVTHNPELAETYATRIVKLRDGRITDDSNPFAVDASKTEPPKHKNMGRSSMSFFTALALSFNNLRTKKARTLLTSFAGSIGIIGIAAILALSTGVNAYIESIQKSTMTSYPISIQAQTVDLSGIISEMAMTGGVIGDADHALDGVYSDPTALEIASSMTSSITENNLTEFKKYLDNPDSEIRAYLGENGVVYSYATKFSVFTYDPENTLVNTDGSTINGNMGMGMSSGMSSSMSMMAGMSNNGFSQIVPGQNGELISPAVVDYYDLVYGAWPAAYNEVVLVLNGNHEIAASTLYQLGILPASEYEQIVDKITAGEKVELEAQKWSYEDICQKKFYLIPESDFYVENAKGGFDYVARDNLEIEKLLDEAVELTITGVISPAEDATGIAIRQTLGYTKALTDHIIARTGASAVVKAQKENPDINVVSGLDFSPADDATKAENARTYVANLGISDKAALYKNMISAMGSMDPSMAGQLAAMGEAQMAAMLDQLMLTVDESALLRIYDAYISTGTYEENMEGFGVVNYDAPSSISIYADSFEDKDAISECIERYNASATEEDRITYTDTVALLMSSVTTIVNVISYVLIAFVSVSLVVSSIMIGIITYISVLERTKEIGILRAIGASKGNIAQVFTAETFIVGLCAGLIGIGVTMLLLIPGNAIIHVLTGSENVNAMLPAGGAVILVILSVVLTLIGGWIPSKKAAKKDPVTALRTE